MTWRDLVCMFLGHRPKLIKHSFLARCECCGAVVNVRTGAVTYR